MAFLLAACQHSSPVTVGASTPAGGGTSAPSGNLGPGDGNSIYLNVLPPGSNGNSNGGLGLPVAGTPASYPANYSDQATLYGDLSYAQAGLQATPCNPPTSISQHVASSNQACNYFKHEGLTPDTVVSSETINTPYGGTVTIQRDGWGVPFITASNRRDVMVGVGYAQAEDRLWLMDALRHIGRGMTSQFLGPAPLFYQVDAGLAVTAGYSEDELTEMVNEATSKAGPVLGPLLLQDIDADVAGVNLYIASLTGANLAKIPPEYVALKNGGYPPASFTRNDVVASAIFIQSLFAVGGGSEVTNEALLQQLDPSVTAGNLNLSASACKIWRDLRHANDPDATRTISTPYYQSPAALNESCPQTLPAGTAIWDIGSYKVFDAYDASGVNENAPPAPVTFTARADNGVKLAQLVTGKGLSAARLAAAAKSRRTPSATRLASAGHGGKQTKAGNKRPVQVAMGPYALLHNALARAGFGVPLSMSNWMAVNAANTADGHPIGVMGPQMGYFQPNLPWEFAVHSTGGTAFDFDGRGMAFGTLPYVLIGRGVDYAWSATSNDSDIIDTRVSVMCNMDGSQPTGAIVNGFPDADGYLYDVGDGKGPQCRRFYKRTDTWTAVPTVASLGSGGSPQPATINRYILRTHYGPVFATATVKGVPVVISTQRSTYFGELDTAIPFALASTPFVNSAATFQHLFNAVTGTFNWLYVDKKDVGYFASGLLPIRDPNQSPELPSWGDGRYEWANDRNLTAAFFQQYGGNVPFPGRVAPAANALPQASQPFTMNNFEWQNFLSFAQHPQAVNPPQGFIASWNNSPAPGWWAADNRANWGPIHRVDTEPVRFKAFLATGKKFNFANVVEIMADAGYTDLRGQELLPLLLQLMNQTSLGRPLSADETTAATLMQNWVDGVASDGKTLDGGSDAWITGGKGLGAWRRSRESGSPGKTTYDNQPAVVLMDAWYLHLMDTVTSQLTALDPDKDQFGLTNCVSNVILCRYDAPRAQGSAFEFGWFQVMYRMLQMALNTPGHTNYQALNCAGAGASPSDCRNAVLSALDSAISDLGGISNMANWNGTQLPNVAGTSNATVETYDEISPTDFSTLPTLVMPWVNRPTYQQVIEVQSGR